MSKSDVKVNSEIPLSTLLQLIPEFDTTKSTQVYRFIRSCDSAFEIASIAQQNIILTFALNKIIGPGSSDVHAKQFLLWTDLKAFLIKKFSNTKTLAHLYLELQSMFQKPNETITEYFLRVDLCRSKILEKLAAEIRDLTLEGRKATTEETALNVFINGLNSDIGTMLRINAFAQLSDAGNFAIQEEKIRNMNSARQRLYRQSILPSPVLQPRKSPIIIPPQRNLQNNKMCNYCKKPGHLIAECRKRAYNNSMNQPQINQNNNYRANLSSSRIPNQINNLNSQAAEDLSTSPGTALVHCSNPAIEYPTTSLDLQIQ